MDKSTLSHYGKIVCTILIIAILLGMAAPFAGSIKDAIMSATNSITNKGSEALGSGSGNGGGSGGTDEEPTIDGGLYKTGSNWTKLIYSWDELIENGIIDNTGKALNKTALEGDLAISNTITEIPTSAYTNCTALTGVYIPNVTDIGYSAFDCCSKLKTVYYTGTLEQWLNISFKNDYANPCINGADLYIQGVKATDITIPSTITEIKLYVFHGCTSLTSVTIPASVTTIKSNAFRSCKNLVSIMYTGTLEQWLNISFQNEFANPCNNGADLYIQGVKTTDITIPSTITEIKPYAFRGCTSLTSVTIPDTVITIGKQAFYQCANLPTVTIGNSVTKIGSMAFYGCRNITSVTIPNSVTLIDYYAFNSCPSLIDVYYTGTQSEWNALFANTGAYNECYTNATIHFNHVIN